MQTTAMQPYRQSVMSIVYRQCSTNCLTSSVFAGCFKTQTF